MVMKRWGLVGLLLIVLCVLVPGTATAIDVSPGGLGDALIFPLIDVNNIDTLIAIEMPVQGSALHLVRFRSAATGATVLQFTLCLQTGATWTASVFRDGSVTRVVSSSTLLVNGSAEPLNATLTGNPTRAFLEVIGLRFTGPGINPLICTDDTVGVQVPNVGLSGRAYYVSGALVPPLVFGGNAVALKDFSAVKITDGTVLANEGVAQALIAQGSGTGAQQSVAFMTRYFVAASFGAQTQLVLAFPTGPTTGGCPTCRVPSSLFASPRTDPGAPLAGITTPADTSLVRIITLLSSNVASDSGLVTVVETPGAPKVPAVGFGVNTTSPAAPLFFNALFPIDIF